jgi:hypothetical protein
MMETGMAEKSKERLWANWMAMQNVCDFPEMLDAQTEDHKYKILAQLLSFELEKLRKAPRH